MAKCPLDKRHNGTFCGISPGGGYGIWSEYQLGAQRIAEETHCILGSLNKKTLGSAVERGHITEELNLIKKDIDEYSRNIYLKPFFYGNRLHEKKKEIFKEIKKNSEKLLKKAKKELKALSDCPLEYKRKGLVNVAEKCYLLLIELARSMKYSVETDDNINAFSSKRLRRCVRELENSINKMYRNENRTLTDGLLWR